MTIPTLGSIRRKAWYAGASVMMALVPVTNAVAQVFDGGGLYDGTQYGNGLGGISTSSDLRQSLLNVMVSVLNFMTILSVATVFIAGIYLIVSLGEEDQKNKAKKIITYTLYGLVVILFCRVIVGLVTEYLKSKVQ